MKVIAFFILYPQQLLYPQHLMIFLDKDKSCFLPFFSPPRTTFIFFCPAKNFSLPSREKFPAQESLASCSTKKVLLWKYLTHGRTVKVRETLIWQTCHRYRGGYRQCKSCQSLWRRLVQSLHDSKHSFRHRFSWKSYHFCQGYEALLRQEHQGRI